MNKFWRFADRAASQYIYLSNWPTWCTKFLFNNTFISRLYMFRAHVFIISRSKLHYTASGIITSIGGLLVQVLLHACTCFEHMCSTSGGQNSITQPLVSSHLYVEAWNELIVSAMLDCFHWHYCYVKFVTIGLMDRKLTGVWLQTDGRTAQWLHKHVNKFKYFGKLNPRFICSFV